MAIISTINRIIGLCAGLIISVRAFSFNATVVILGDITADGVVGILDAIVLNNSFNNYPRDQYRNPDADIKDDDIVDILDAIALANHFSEQFQ